MNRSIVKVPDNILKEPCKEVEEINPFIRNLVLDMSIIMAHLKGIGIAAPQVGENIKLCIINPSPSIFRVMLNPRIIAVGGETFVEEGEGCLSIPGKYIHVDRYEEVRVEYVDMNGNKKVEDFKGLAAIVASHEIDHLNGILITDYENN